MKNQLSTKLEIDDISKINIHHQYDTHIPVCNITQLDTGVISIGLYNGSIVFFAPTNLDEPYLCFQVDKFPIYSIIQIEDDQLIVASGKNLYYLFDTKRNSNFEKKEKIINDNIYGNINKILLMYDKSILIGDDKYISIFQKDKKNINFVKHIKINAPVMNLYLIQTSLLLAAVPSMQKVIFIDLEKFIKTYEIEKIKFYPGIKYNNIIVRLSKDLIAIGGCMGSIYLINLKHKQFMANASIRYRNEIITCIYIINNGDMVCGTSLIVKDSQTQKEYISSNLVQYRYENQTFKEVHRKKDVHENIIEKIIEIVNHKGINEFATISLDGKFKIWD